MPDMYNSRLTKVPKNVLCLSHYNYEMWLIIAIKSGATVYAESIHWKQGSNTEYTLNTLMTTDYLGLLTDVQLQQ